MANVETTFIVSMVGGEVGTFVSKIEEKYEKVGNEEIYNIYFKPASRTNGFGSFFKYLFSEGICKLPYRVPKSAIREYTFGVSGVVGTPFRLMLIDYDADHFSLLNSQKDKEYQKVIEEKNRLISDLSTKIATQGIEVSDSKEETKKQLKDLKDTNKVIEKEKPNPMGLGNENPWRRDEQ